MEDIFNRNFSYVDNKNPVNDLSEGDDEEEKFIRQSYREREYDQRFYGNNLPAAVQKSTEAL